MKNKIFISPVKMGSCLTIQKYIEKQELKKCTLNNTAWLSLSGKTILAKVVDVYDADTITIALKWEKKYYLEKCRLAGIDGAEMHPRLKNPNREAEIKHAQRGKKRLEELVLNKVINVVCGDWDKYGRLLGTLYITSQPEKSVNQILIEDGMAYPYDGRKKKEFSDWYK